MAGCLESSQLLQMVLLVMMLGSVMIPGANSAPYRASKKDKILCELGCGYGRDSGDFCPDWCPERSFAEFGLRMPDKKSSRPFSDELGNLSFDDYLFLKTVGRQY